MNPVSNFLTRHFRRHRKHDTLVVESAPLHTERPEWAAHAPAQVEAACKRGAHVIGFTELGAFHKVLISHLKPIAAEYGYEWFQGHDDTVLLVKANLHATSAVAPVTHDTSLLSVTFEFHGSTVTVFSQHWLTWHPANLATREAQTAALVHAMDLASAKSGLAFYLGDCNPHGLLSSPSSDPRAALDRAGHPLVYETVGFPSHIGVNAIGHAARDGRVKPVSAVTHDALGSDHIPTTATFEITRPR